MTYRRAWLTVPVRQQFIVFCKAPSAVNALTAARRTQPIFEHLRTFLDVVRDPAHRSSLRKNDTVTESWPRATGPVIHLHNSAP